MKSPHENEQSTVCGGSALGRRRTQAPVAPTQFVSFPTHVALSDTESVASEPPPSLVDALEHDLNGVPALNRGRRLRTRIGSVPIGAEVPRALRQQRWSPMNVPLIWAASGSEETNPVLQWLVAAASAVEEPIEFYEGGILASDPDALRAALRGWGVTEREGLSTWLRNNGFVATTPGNHIAARAQEFIFSEAIATDARVALRKAACVTRCISVVNWPFLQQFVSLPGREWSRGETFRSSFPDGSWGSKWTIWS